MTSINRKRIGILVDKYIINEHENYIINDLLQFIPRDNIYLIFCGDSSATSSSRNFSKLRDIFKMFNLLLFEPAQFFKAFLLKVIYFLEIDDARRIYPDFLVYNWNIKDYGFQEVIISKTFLPSNRFRWSSPPNDCKKLQSLNFDAIYRMGSCGGIISGEILSIPKFGIISFHHGDNRKYRGGPSGFWEALNKENEIGFIIQRLTEELDGGHIFYRKNFPSCRYWLGNSATLLYFSKFDFAHVLHNIIEGKCLAEESLVGHDQPTSRIYRIKDFRPLLAYIRNKFISLIACMRIYA